MKVITGIRRCGKTYLLFNLFRDRLRKEGVDASHVIEIRLDRMRDLELRDPKLLYAYVMEHVIDDGLHYVLIDEVQEAISTDEFKDLAHRRPALYAALNDFLAEENLDVFVTGSNSRFLSSDVMTEFRDRGTEVRLHPLTFSEFAGASNADPRDLLELYLEYGGMPRAVLMNDVHEKRAYLEGLFEGTYKRDIIERYGIRKGAEMDALMSFVASNIGNLASARNIVSDLRNEMGSDISPTTVIAYLQYLSESFVVNAVRLDSLQGREVLRPRHKYYFEDVGLRNARLEFTQTNRSQLLENVVYNELIARRFNVHVGRLKIWDTTDSKPRYKDIECDFVARRGDERFYVQVAWSIEDTAVEQREKRPLLAIRDANPKVVIVGDRRGRARDRNGILIVGAIDFLTEGL